MVAEGICDFNYQCNNKGENMKITPINNRVLVELIIEKKTDGGIIIPDSQQKSGNEGIIKAIPKDCKDFKVGDRIKFEGWGITRIKDRDKELTFVDFDNIIAIIKEKL